MLNVVGYIPATLLSITTLLVMIVASTIAYFLFAEIPTSEQIIGSMVILSGLILVIQAQTK